MRSTRFERLPPISSPSAAGSTGWRAPERAKNTTIQTTAAAVTNVTIAVAPAKSPNAMPGVLDVVDRERPDDVHRVVERERARDDVLRHLVGDHGGERDRREPGPLPDARRRASARRPRAASARPSTSRRAHRGTCCGSLNRRAAGRRCRGAPTGSRAAGPRRSARRSVSHVPYVPSSIRASAASISSSVCCAPSSSPWSSSRS